MNINGSCFCKKIAFKGKVDPEKCFACHCEDCQIFSGAPYRGVVQCEKTNLNIKGKPKEYIKIGSSGNRRIQSFCEKCGTHLFASDIEKTLFNIRIGCIEQRNKLIPKKHIFASSAHKWIHTIKKCEWYTTTINSKKITI